MKTIISTGIILILTLTTPKGSWSQQQQTRQTKVADTNLVLPPAWAFGVLYGGYTNQQETIKRVDSIIAQHYPIDAYWIDSWFWSHADKGIGPHKYIDFVADTVGYPDRKKMWSHLQQNGIKGGFWTWDCILETGNEKAFHDFKKQGYFSSIYINKNSWHNKGTSTAMFQEKAEHPGTACGNIDFDNPAAVGYFKQQMKHFFTEGADFIKLDRTSKISTCKAMFEMSQEFGLETRGRGFILSHTGGMETEEYKRYPTKWTDDTRSDWNIEQPLIKFNTWVPSVALKENIALFTDPKNPTSRIPFLTNDLGGFDMGYTQKPAEELYIRWLQFSMFNPITEVFSQPENPTANLAWNYSTRADSLFRYYAHWRMQLFPYIYSYAHRSRLEGKPMIGKLAGQLYEYMFGDELLIAPVYENGAVTRKVSLPEGKWINYWTGEKLSGNKEYEVNAPLQQIPVFLKEGAIIPSRQYASSIEKGTNDTLMLDIYPGKNGRFQIVEDDGVSNDYLKGIFAKTTIELKKTTLQINPTKGTFTGQAINRNWIIRFYSDKKPRKVVMNGQSCNFVFNPDQKITSVNTGEQSIRKKWKIRLFL